MLPWALVSVLLIASVSLGWWAITMREEQRDLVARVQRLQASAPDRVAPAIVFFGPDTTHATLAGPTGRWVVLVVHVKGDAEADTRLELRLGRVSLWTAREPARRGVVVPAALPASLLPAGEYELVVNDQVHRLTVTAATMSSRRSGPSGT